MVESYDHTGAPVAHYRLRVNGIRMHGITAGSGPPIVLLHGTPKNSFYWHKLLPLLTPHFTVVAPDLRGFGFTDKPPAAEGYDCLTNAHDIADLSECSCSHSSVCQYNLAPVRSHMEHTLPCSTSMALTAPLCPPH